VVLWIEDVKGRVVGNGPLLWKKEKSNGFSGEESAAHLDAYRHTEVVFNKTGS